MCLKTDTILLKPTLDQFQCFITTCLCMVKRFQSNSFIGNDLMVLFNWGWSRLINKTSLIRNLNLRQRLEYQNNQSTLNSYIQVDDQILLIF